jgi:hypothetical protein
VRGVLPAIWLACLPACDLLVPPVRAAVAPSWGTTPPAGPERDCTARCASIASRCSTRQCASGCSVAVDRFVQGEGPGVVACVAAEGSCDERTWARCAVRVGPYADGGPPAPPPPSDWSDEP